MNIAAQSSAAELYWDLVLCKYGVTYVKDPKTGKYIPTCNRTHYTPIFSDENYKKAIELSAGEKKALGGEDAKLYMFRLETNKEGGNGHPSLAAYEIASQQLTGVIVNNEIV